MAKKSCPVKGYKGLVIEYPDDLLVEHENIFATAVHAAMQKKPESTPNVWRFEGCRALCKTFEVPDSLKDKPVEKWPLAPFKWVLNTVYYDHYEPAANPPKN
jgi:hypothetical protein